MISHISIVLTLMIDITQKMNCSILVACLRMLWSQSMWCKQGNICSSSMPVLGIHRVDLFDYHNYDALWVRHTYIYRWIKWRGGMNTIWMSKRGGYRDLSWINNSCLCLQNVHKVYIDFLKHALQLRWQRIVLKQHFDIGYSYLKTGAC